VAAKQHKWPQCSGERAGLSTYMYAYIYTRTCTIGSCPYGPHRVEKSEEALPVLRLLSLLYLIWI